MSTPKKIEELEELTTLNGDELLMTEVTQSGQLASNTTRKMTLNTLANYVNSIGEGGGIVSHLGGYEIYDLSNSDENYINGETVGNDGFTKTFTRDCEILVTPSPVPTVQGQYGNITVKVDNVQVCTGLFALGVDNLAQFYVKAGQTLSISRNSGTVKVYSRPLKFGGNFFIDGTEVLSSPFTGIGRFSGDASSNNEFTFTAPRKTLFIYTSSQGAYIGSVKINDVEINQKYTNYPTAHNYDKLILDTNDTITFTFTGVTYMMYCALPLLEV